MSMLKPMLANLKLGEQTTWDLDCFTSVKRSSQWPYTTTHRGRHGIQYWVSDLDETVKRLIQVIH